MVTFYFKRIPLIASLLTVVLHGAIVKVLPGLENLGIRI